MRFPLWLSLSAATLPILACGVDPLDDVEVGATTQEVRVRGDDDGIIIMNGLTPATLTHSLLLANVATRSALVGRPLTSASFASSPLKEAVQHDDQSRVLLQYLARCALPQGTSLVAGGFSFAGESGLCPEWSSGGVGTNAACQEKVSACLLSLVNVRDRHVPLSVQGDLAGFEAGVQVRPLPGPLGQPIHDTTACSAWQFGMNTDCGWDSNATPVALAQGTGAVYACTPGTPVVVSGGSRCATGAMLGAMGPSSDKVLRVCDGLSPCDRSAALAQAESDSCGTVLPEVRFTCPASKAFTVMSRDYQVAPGSTGGLGVVRIGVLGARVATEAELFPVREGAFYGTVFDGPLAVSAWLDTSDPYKPKVLTKVINPAQPVFSKAWACFDHGWSNPAALEAERLCALPGMPCLVENTGVCQKVCEQAGPVFKQCRDPSAAPHLGLTTFLRERCDQFGVQTPACQ